jgi:streptogramin lyase
MLGKRTPFQRLGARSTLGACSLVGACLLLVPTSACFSSSSSGGPSNEGSPDATADGSDDVDSSAPVGSEASTSEPDASTGEPDAATDASATPDASPEAGAFDGEAGPSCADDLGKIYVADGLNNERVVRVDDMCVTNWTALSSVSGPEASLMSVGEPEGVFVDSAGKIYMASTFGNNSIIRIDDMTGANWTSVGTTGSGTLQFQAPKDVFVDGSGHIYVTDSFNYRIVRMDDMTGKNWTTFGTRGTGVNQFSVPTSIFVDAAGHIYVTDGDVADSFDRVVRIDDMTGKNWTTFGAFGTGVDQFSALWGVFVDPTGHIYLTDSGNARVVRVDDMTGTNWTTYGTMGTGVGGFYSPTGIFVDAGGRIYVIDAAESAYGTDDGIVRMDDMTGKNWLRFGRYGGQMNEFNQATGLWVH